MKEKIYEKATEYIETLASSMGVAAEHVYGVLVRQQFAEGITLTVLLPVILVVLGLILRFCIKKQNENYNDDGYMVATVLLGIFTGLLLVVSLFVIPESIMKMINPEYYAIKEIMDVLKGGES